MDTNLANIMRFRSALAQWIEIVSEEYEKSPDEFNRGFQAACLWIAEDYQKLVLDVISVESEGE